MRDFRHLYPGYMDVPRDVMQGHQLMVEEAVQQLGQRPTHVFVQGGVGGLAAVVRLVSGARRRRAPLLRERVEASAPDCLMRSARQPAGGGQRRAGHLMAGLACGEVSLLAWDILATGVTLPYHQRRRRHLRPCACWSALTRATPSSPANRRWPGWRRPSLMAAARRRESAPRPGSTAARCLLLIRQR